MHLNPLNSPTHTQSVEAGPLGVAGSIRIGGRAGDLLMPLGTVFILALLLALPALWNGVPLFYYDSVDYVRLPFTFEVPVFRTAPYGVFAGLGRLIGSLWAVIAAQSLMVAYVLWLTARTLAPSLSPFVLVGVVGVLCLVTGLPWYTSQVMADAFSGAVVLGIITLALGGRSLGWLHGTMLVIIVAVGTAVHTSHIGVAAGLVLVLVGLRLLRRWLWRMPKIHLVPPMATVALALALVISANWAATGRAFLMQPTENLTLGLFIENGLAKRYLDEVCLKQPSAFRLCPYRDELPKTANGYLWGFFDRSPFYKLGGWKNPALSEEAEDIVEGSIDAYPVDLALVSLAFTARQFIMVQTGDGLVPMNWHIEEAIRRFYPEHLHAFLQAPQQHGLNFGLLNPAELFVYLGATLLLPAAAVVAWRRGVGSAAVLPMLVLLALLGNAFICGALSNPAHRYQGRTAWVPVFALVIVASQIASRSRWQR